MATALDRWDEEGGAQELAWPLPYDASDLRDVERRVLECLGADGRSRDLAGDGDDRDAVHEGRCQAGDQVGGAGAAGRDADADFASCPCITISRVRRILFMSHEDVS